MSEELRRLRESDARLAPSRLQALEKMNVERLKQEYGAIMRPALAYAIVAIGALPAGWREDTDRWEMVRLLRLLAGSKQKFKSDLDNARRHLSQNGAVTLATTPLDPPADEPAADKPEGV